MFRNLSLASLILTIANSQLFSVVGPWMQINYTAFDNIIASRISIRAGTAGAYLPSTNEYVVFGGDTSFGRYRNDFYAINLTSVTYRELSTVPVPGSRTWSAFASGLNDFYIHGGYDGSVRLDDFWRYNGLSRQWSQLAKGPSARNGHCLEMMRTGNNLFLVLFGGRTSSSTFSQELWYHSSTNVWALELSAIGGGPSGRDSHACASNTHSNLFFVQGGGNPQTNFQDLWSFNITSKNWVRIDPGRPEVQLYSHSMKYSITSNALYLFLGHYRNTSQISQEIFQYSLLNNSQQGWRLATITGTKIPARFSVSSGFNPTTGEYFVFGGYTLTGVTFNDLWKIKIDDVIPATTTMASRASSTTRATTVSAQMETTVITTSDKSSTFVNVVTKTNVSRKSSVSSSLRIEKEDMNISFLEYMNRFKYYIIAGALMLLFTMWLVFMYTLRRRIRIRNDESRTISSSSSIAKTEQPSTMSAVDYAHQYASQNSTGDSSMGYFSSSNATSSTYNSKNAQTFDEESETSVTLASSELGLSVPIYLNVEFNISVRERSVLAQGGFGKVIVADAMDQKLKRFGDLVIVKQIKKKKLTDRDLQLFNQEISLMEYFKNEKFMAKLLGYSIDPYCLIMKYYKMGSLKEFIKTARSRCKIHVLNFSKDIAWGLQAMHMKGVVHNDLKPDNVLLDMHNGQIFCVLTDLGISQVITPQILKVQQFQVAQINGLSLAYAAPERIEMFRKCTSLHPALANHSVIFSWDFYSLGVIIHELLVGALNI